MLSALGAFHLERKLQMISDKKLCAALTVVLDEYGPDHHRLRLRYFWDEQSDPESLRFANKLERSFRYLERWEWLLAREMEKEKA
jgi:hypothetical protein